MGASKALQDGKNAFIDRCNLEREQRAEFVKLGSPEIDVHAIVLDLPAKLCISRSVKRTEHEGNLQGGKAAAVVNRMLQKKELPKLTEGYSRITVCQTETDVQAAVVAYSTLGPLDTLPPGYYGQKSQDAKIQLGIMKFLKKADASVDKELGQKDSGDKAITKGNKASLEVKADDKAELGSSSHGTSCSNDIPTLAFPSISTADFQFDLEKASDIIVEQVAEFVSELENARLALVDLSHSSKILSLVRAKAVKKNIDPNKFLTVVGDITLLKSKGGIQCSVIANAANWRLKPGGGGVNAAVFNAAGPSLEKATKEQAESMSPGNVVTVHLPSTSPLFIREGVTHVIHVLGPNMNPQRPNCLKDNYVEGCNVLRKAYASLFQSFVGLVKSQEKSHSTSKVQPSDLKISPKTHDQKVKREGVFESDMNNKKHKGTEEVFGRPGDEMDTMYSGKERKKWGSWAQALYNIAMHPEEHKNDVLEISDNTVVLNDVYPKAKVHILILARVKGLDSLADVHKDHIQLLNSMHEMGIKWAEKYLNEDNSLTFRLGYHSTPSMRQLHLHVISQDFDSKHLKNKKHWNSFNSDFFLDSVDVIAEIEEHGQTTLKDVEKLLSMELRCHRCRSVHPNIPRLKTHIANCQAPFPPALLNRLKIAARKDELNR
ncbi:transcription factor bHLH140 isoform X2 [Impatiens glandulifera]|nr:transcription factor bHLH140 isoform X2 [Impatiens glandulifera]